MSKATRNKLGKNIRNLRREKDWSQEELADKVGLHRTYVGAIERGEQNVTIDTLAKIAKALSASFTQLFKDM
ncbi:MAG TPA: helix-turn-helix transcriptional regulator [Candidatus Saccharimonadales bacterium]|nr:helix-turn-helix transcriptional regulator [Candidatus Saccharimonadales bacterium]